MKRADVLAKQLRAVATAVLRGFEPSNDIIGPLVAVRRTHTPCAKIREGAYPRQDGSQALHEIGLVGLDRHYRPDVWSCQEHVPQSQKKGMKRP